MYEAAFKNIDDTLWKDAGCSSELDYIEQTSWILFLKYLNDYETDKSNSALLNGEVYNSILIDEFSWTTWATPKSSDGNLDHNAALTGDDLLEFVNLKLFPYLKQFKVSADNANTLEYKIGEIFSEISNKLQSGYALREVINKVDELSFLSNDDKYELSSLYEDKIKNMGYGFAFKGGLSFSLGDIIIPREKIEMIDDANSQVDVISGNYNMGLITNNERYNQVIDVWTSTNAMLTELAMKRIS